jgi:thiol-disulfide isomerase/thioredoxin
MIKMRWIAICLILFCGIAKADEDIYCSYVFTAKWCQPCNKFKTVDIPALKECKWNISEKEWSKGTHLVIIDIDENPELFAKYASGTEKIPFFVTTKNGKKLKDHSGYMNSKDFSNWRNNIVVKSQNKSL